MQSDNQSLIKKCILQDRRAQKALYDQYKDAMYTLMYRILGDTEEAGDALQESFIQVFKGLSSFRGESTIGTWIKTICVRTAYTRIRKSRAHVSLDQIPEGSLIDWGETPLDVEYVEQAIRMLPDGYRAIFVLIEIEGYSHKEVAELLGISAHTSRSQLSKAKKKLRALLSPLITI